jgi:hypothetical protein
MLIASQDALRVGIERLYKISKGVWNNLSKSIFRQNFIVLLLPAQIAS